MALPRASWRARALALPAVLALALTAASCDSSDDTASDDTSTSSSTMTTTSDSETTSGSNAGSATATTEKAVAAAEAFLASLSDEQKETVQFDADDATLESGWSNLPAARVERNGIAYGDLSDEQKELAEKLMVAAMGTKGSASYDDSRATDTYLEESSDSQIEWGGDLYYIAFFGTPSTDSLWVLQTGGHHYARNISFNGGTISITPAFSGAEPRSWDNNGTEVAPTKEKREALWTMLGGLSTDEQASAELSGTFRDILMGPGNDTDYPTSEGLTVGDLTEDQQQLVLDAIMTYVGDAPDAVASELAAAYKADFADTKIGWAGSATAADTEGTYARIDGPRVWIELVVQGGVGTDGVHDHSIYRDKSLDYGTAQ